jgi:hypothetical protein
VRAWKKRELAVGDMILTGGAVALAVRMVIDYDGHVAQSASAACVLFGLAVASDAPGPSRPLQQRVVGVLAIFALGLTVVLAWRGAVLDVDDSAPDADADTLSSYAAAFPFDVEPRLKIAARSLDGLDVCERPDGCPVYARIAHGALDPDAERAHPPSAALVLRARVFVHEGKLDAALHDVDAALAVDPGNPLAHQVGISIDRSEARIEAARRWHVAVPDA